jgi:hypothetical protein
MKKKPSPPSPKDEAPVFDDIQQHDPKPDMSTVPIGTVAMVAATLSRPDVSAFESVIKAYDILEYVAAGQAYLKGNQDCLNGIYYPAALSVSAWLKHEYYPPEREEDPTEKYAIYGDQCYLPIPFEDALKAIDPRPGKAINRLPRFRQWMIDKYQITMIDAGEKIAEWKKTGIPWGDFCLAFHSFPKWRKWRTSENNKLSAAKSREAKKGKQGQVKKKTDKRKGARPDRDKLKKAIGAS